MQLKPLQWLAQHPSDRGRTRQIFLLTDGEISNVAQILDLCRSMASSTRIFSFGLGHSPSRSLVKGLARSTNGRFVFIPPNTSVDVQVGEQLRKALQLCITNVHIKWNLGVDVQSAPRRSPPVYVNDRLIVYGLVDDDKTIPFDHNPLVELQTEYDHHRLAMAKIDRVPSVSDNRTIVRLAAKALILELQHNKFPTRSGSMQERFDGLSMANKEKNEYLKCRSLSDFEELAKKLMMPHRFYYYDYKAGQEYTYQTYRHYFDKQLRIMPRVLMNVSEISLKTTIFG
ncbi:unnamed protein product [Rotaria sp. Silwood1]